MKKKILILVISLFSSLLLAQQDQMFVCGMGDTSFYRSPEDRGGLYTPSEGNLKAIVVFIQFQGCHGRTVTGKRCLIIFNPWKEEEEEEAILQKNDFTL